MQVLCLVSDLSHPQGRHFRGTCCSDVCRDLGRYPASARSISTAGTTPNKQPLADSSFLRRYAIYPISTMFCESEAGSTVCLSIS